mmetsp:Transcript_8292/g.19685  ORF Transcript_8292/g.19685 Transcript_8292/m.19685 type:complete len:170 (-) Transcript_8292:18-527(-)
MLVSDELNKRGRGRNPKYTARAQPVMSLTKAVDKVRALPELRKQDAAQYIGRFCRAQLRCWAHARQQKKVSGASPFWCAKATRDATLRQDAKYKQEQKKVLAQLAPQMWRFDPQVPAAFAMVGLGRKGRCALCRTVVYVPVSARRSCASAGGCTPAGGFTPDIVCWRRI